MIRRAVCVGTLLALSLSAFAQESVQARAVKVTSKLEVLNNLGRECESHLQVESMKGASSAACTKYLKNIQGAYFTSIGKECASLSEWYESKRQLVIKNPDYAEENPEEAAQLVKDIVSFPVK